MTTETARRTLRQRIQPRRLLTGAVAEMVVRAYGVGALVAVALSDAESVGGKARDAVAAVPTLVEEYQDARYVVDHREEIQDAITYLDQNAPAQEELQRTIDESSATLGAIETTYSEVGRARDVLEFDGVRGTIDNAREAIGHVNSAWEARPELDSIRELREVAAQVGPLVDEVEVLVPVYYGGMASVIDNFARDEIAGTLLVMALALVVAAFVGRSIGFWIRRGQPGILTLLVQRLGVRVFPRWYADNVPHVVGSRLYAMTRGDVHRQIAADPEGALDPETFRELEEYFARRSPAG